MQLESKKNPLVTIIMPTYNRVSFLDRTLQTISAQTYTNFELIIIDDASTDNTSSVVSEYIKKDPRIRYLRNEKNLKIVKSLNYGLNQAKGVYIARADDDDPWIDSRKLETQISFLEENPDYVLVGTGAVVVDENGKELFRYLQPQADKKIRNRMLFGNPFIHGTVVFRKSVLEKTGLYDERFIYTEDWRLWAEIGRYGQMYNLPLIGVERYYGERGISIQNRHNIGKTRLYLIKEYRHIYPNFYIALVFNSLQGIYNFLPYYKKLDNSLFKLKRKSLEK